MSSSDDDAPLSGKASGHSEFHFHFTDRSLFSARCLLAHQRRTPNLHHCDTHCLDKPSNTSCSYVSNFPTVSAATIPKSVDRAMDKATSKKDLAPAGISVRNGPVNGDMMGVDEVVTNGKRKSRGSAAHMSYKEQESDEEDEPKPQVCSYVMHSSLHYVRCMVADAY
jgi:hypothetical protein